MTASLRLVPDESPIATLRGTAWPASKRDFRQEQREHADSQPRVVVCGFCGCESPLLDGPTGRAWFASHSCHGRAA